MVPGENVNGGVMTWTHSVGTLLCRSCRSLSDS